MKLWYLIVVIWGGGYSGIDLEPVVFATEAACLAAQEALESKASRVVEAAFCVDGAVK